VRTDDPGSTRAALVDRARRHSRVADEVEDLAHDILVTALRRGLPLVDGPFFEGAARRHAAFLARTAARRRAREQSAGAVVDAADQAGFTGEGGAALEDLPPTLRTTALLLVSGLRKAEIRAALGITDAALRKRFQALRGRAPLALPEVRPPAAPICGRLRRVQVAALPALAAALPTDPQGARVLGVHDPDGHGLILRAAHTRPPRGNDRGPEDVPREPQGEPPC
jgi:DNA-directed RNA polymerase specialized sigma24 family protein